MDLTDLIEKYNVMEDYMKNPKLRASQGIKDPTTEFFDYVKEHADIISEFKPETSFDGLKLLFIQDLTNDIISSSDRLGPTFELTKTLVVEDQDISALLWAFTKFQFTDHHFHEFYNVLSKMFTTTLPRERCYQCLKAFLLVGSHLYQEELPVQFNTILRQIITNLDWIEELLQDDPLTKDNITILTDLTSKTFMQIHDTWRRDAYKELGIEGGDHMNYVVSKYARYTMENVIDVLEMVSTIRGMLYRLHGRFFESGTHLNAFNRFLFDHILTLNGAETSLLSSMFSSEVRYHINKENFDEAVSWQQLRLITNYPRIYELQVREIQRALDLIRHTVRIDEMLKLYSSLISIHAMSQQLRESINTWQEMKRVIEQLASPVNGLVNYYSWLMDSFADIASIGLRKNEMGLVEPILNEYFEVISRTNGIPTGMLEKLKIWSETTDKPQITMRIDKILDRVHGHHQRS